MKRRRSSENKSTHRGQGGASPGGPSRAIAKPRHLGGGRSGGARPRSTPVGQREGIVSAHRSGFGFVRFDASDDSAFLPPREMTGLMPGDRVRISVTQSADGRFAGEVLEVLARGVSAFLGTVEISGRTAWVHAVDRRLGLRCQVPIDGLGGAKAGDWVIARITRHPTAQHSGQAMIERRLDPLKPLEMGMETAIAKYSLPTSFPPEVLREAESWGNAVDAQEAARRVDLRELPLVTIDGPDAKDFDDAVFAEETAAGYRLIVAIADVSHYVRPGTALDTEAAQRGTSVYFPGRVLPMLPNALSDKLCSLQPNVDRLCFAADMTISGSGQLRAAKFYPAVMRSHARLTYGQAHEVLFERKTAAIAALGPLAARLEPLLGVYHALAKSRRRRGALDFDSTEAIFEFNEAQGVRAIKSYPRNDAHRLIEECMIMANVAVAAELREQRVPTLFRVHGQPEARKIDLLTTVLATLGIAADLPEEPKPRDLRAITEKLGKRAERGFVESLVVRAMPQALYQPTNIGHFGLALTEYSHFTSPIRRYPDLVVHRTLKARLSVVDTSGARYEAAHLSALGQELSRLEKRSDEADRYVDNFLKCSYLRERLGQTFDAVVTTVVEFGCFVQILEVGVDGLLHLDNLRDDEYRMESHGHAWVGLKSKRRLAPGTKLRVIVVNANPVEGLIDLELG